MSSCYLYARAEGHEWRLITPNAPLRSSDTLKAGNVDIGTITLGWASAHISGRVVNPQGRGLPSLTVLAQGRSNPCAVTTTDSKGYFRINNLVPGEPLDVRVFYDDPRSEKRQYLPRLPHFPFGLRSNRVVDVFAGGKIDRDFLPQSNEIWHRSDVKAGGGKLEIRLESVPAPWLGKEVQSAEQVFGLHPRRRPKPE